MIFGMSTILFVHVALSLVGILAGVVAVYGLVVSRWFGKTTAVFLLTTAATSATGYALPADHLLPSHIVGAISLVVHAIAMLALYSFHLVFKWRWIYVVRAVISLYLNVFVLVAQGFAKLPALHALAPTQAEPPFAIAQGIVLVIFIVIGAVAAKRFRP